MIKEREVYSDQIGKYERYVAYNLQCGLCLLMLVYKASWQLMMIKHLIASHQSFRQGRGGMCWSFRMNQYSIPMNIASDHGLQEISRQSRRRGMDTWCMSPTSYPRPSVRSSYQKIRLPSNLHFHLSSIYLCLRHKRSLTQERALTTGRISTSWSTSSSIQLKSSSTHIQRALQSLCLIGHLHTKALHKMPSMSTTWMWTLETIKEDCVTLSSHSTTQSMPLVKKTHMDKCRRCASWMTTLTQSSGGNQRGSRLFCRSTIPSGTSIWNHAKSMA